MKLNLEQKILDKMKDNEIDGDALILLIKNNYKFSDLKLMIRKKIIEYLETDCFILQNNIKDNEVYKEIYTEEIDKLWEENKFKKLKLGNKLKYIKYLIIRDPPPEIEKKNELDNYLNKIIENENNINEIQENFKDLLNFNENDLNSQFQEWDLDNDNIFKLKLIIKYIKQNEDKLKKKEEKNNDQNKKKDKSIIIIHDEANRNRINEVNKDINKENELKNKNNDNNKSTLNSLNSIDATSPTLDKKKCYNYSFYCVVEVFIYDTSQREKTYGFRNPVEDFKKICINFNINFKNNCSFIDYNDAEKIKLTTFMLWGSKEGLKKFLNKNGVEKLFIEYMTKNDYLDKAGIYLCFNEDENIGYLIIWPGKFSYDYSEITEPNDNVLLTLVRYGFSISSNSILCFTKEELETIDFEGYDIFEDNGEALQIERREVEINEIKEKTFKIGEKQFLTEGLNDIFKNKKIVDSKINQNCVFFYEDQVDNIDCEEIKNGEFYELISKLTKNESNINFYFEDSFNVNEIDQEKFYSLIKKNPYYLMNKNNDEICSEQQLYDIIKEKINNFILDLNKQLNEELLNNNYYNKFICFVCKKTKKESDENLYYFEKKNKNKNDTKIIYVHKSCSQTKIFNSNKKYKCFVCKKKDIPLYVANNIYFHESCNPILDDGVINLEKYKIYEKIKDSIINDKKYDVIKNYIIQFFKSCESKFESISKMKYFTSFFVDVSNPLKIDDKIINQKLTELNTNINKDNKKKSNFSLKKTEDEKKIKIWKNKWKENINKYYINNKNKIDEWVILKSWEKIQQSKNIGHELKLNYEIKKKIKKRIIVHLYEIMTYAHSKNLILSQILNSQKFIEKEKFENYFNQENEGLYIYKNGEKNLIYINDKDFIETGLYDYDNISKTLIVYREENDRKKIGIYFNKENKINKTNNLKILKDLDINPLFDPSSKLHKIKLIPCVNGYENQSVLLFIDNEIHMRKIKSEEGFGTVLNLKKDFEYKDFDEFQFIVYFDFLLILKYNEENKKWESKVFSLNIEDKSIFEEIKNTSIIIEGINKEAKFSFAEIKEKIFLFAVIYSEGNKYSIIYWEISSQISGISTKSKVSNIDENKSNKKIEHANCIINYFYHCFEKYPLLGAIQLNFIDYLNQKQIKINIGFYLDNFNANNDISNCQKYINRLKKNIHGYKKDLFDNIDFNFIDDYKKNYNIKDSSLGSLLIKFLEIIPIQIAKIIGGEFRVMSNGENIDKIINIETQKRENMHKDTKFNISQYSEMINFSIKESIFEFFELPVIVICCFGTQSIGKSTFLNELTGSLFDVSGMRCTEGIWMAIKLFMHPKKNNENKCNKKCECCRKNECCLLHFRGDKEKKCVCYNCICGKECFLNGKNVKNQHLINCDSKCCLEKGHENTLNCKFTNCDCKCVCECKCKKNEEKSHNHLCKKCCKENKEECNCKCNCKHFCKYPILLHNFICVCLDFEGLGTFERTSEQDIQMALIGSAMGNSIIFRTNNSFDRFTEETLEQLSLGSRRIKDIEINEFFGGSLFFSPRDANKTNQDQLKREFSGKIKNSVKKWINENKTEINRPKKYNIFGLFYDYVFAPTPHYNEKAFYETLRKNIAVETIENIIKFQRHPIYKTGKEFYKNLKIFLSAVYMNNYQSLFEIREDEIKSYINENKEKAFEVCGEYKVDEEYNDINYICEINQLKVYFNTDYLSNLEINFLYNKKFENIDNLIIDNITCVQDIQESQKIIEEYGINLNIKKTQENVFSISITNFKDFGLMLMVPKIIKNVISKNDDLCFDFFKLWKNICEKLNFKEKEIVNSFKEFILALVKRRNNNVNKWLQEITRDFQNLKNLEKTYSPLDNIWKICYQKCKHCFLKCCKLQGHDNIHECPYDHKCKEKCSICQNCKCIDEKCEEKCNDQLGHSGIHVCNHKHQCKKMCDLYPDTNDCKGQCILEYNHKEKHNCGVEIHHCKYNCHLAGKTKNCGEKCIYSYPHEGKYHICEKTHYCIDKCKYKGQSKGCNEDCKLEYGHQGIHLCDGKHYCINDCHLKDKARNCKEKCLLEHPHEGKEHSCGNVHYCKDKCDYFEKSEGCKEICTREYGHNEIHLCNGKHYCTEDCYLKDKAKNCGVKCKLEYPHNGKEHNCINQHKCWGKCSLISESINCNKECDLNYGHDKECKCDLKEEHICKQRCSINKNCNNLCSLTARHSDKHLCGKCKCPESCKYKNYSSNCNGKCHLKGGHSEKEHLCGIIGHKCKFDCHFKDNSKNCNNKCKEILENDPNHNEKSNHLCEIEKEKHGCSGVCHLKEDSINCKIDCILEVNHFGEHLCERPLEKHLCKEKCYLRDKSQNCKENCCKKAKHEGQHICSLKYKKHICNKKCNYYAEPGKLCNENCIQQAEHTGDCICKKPKNQHICNENCIYKDKANGCKQYCNKPLWHEGEHNCGTDHLCKNKCSFIENADNKSKCQINCYLPYEHQGICKCDENRHLCGEKCKLINARYCKMKCNKFFGHEGEHLCKVLEENHLCKKKCYYYNKFNQIKNERAKCNEFCSLLFGHQERCICKPPYNHLCDKKCYLFEKSNGCNEDCSLEYDHEGNHKCSVKENSHTCKEKCLLCDHECGHAYNHNNEKNGLICNKCNKTKCVLSGQGHLCGGQHYCEQNCNVEGYCRIEPFVKQEEKIYETKSGEKIKYILKFQEIQKNKCSIKIKENEFFHSGIHKCDVKSHQCGFQCIQCHYYCCLDFGHNGLHSCYHGSIKESTISISDSNYALVQKNNEYYRYHEGENVIAFSCNEYCSEQGQGHTHEIYSENIIDNENTKFIHKNSNYYVYQCKCSYFWENILKFNGNFTNEQKMAFSRCNYKCTSAIHTKREFCNLELWHNEVDKIPKGVEGNWVSKGHVLKCQHPNAAYTIFLIDQSGSMQDNSIVPTESEYKNKMKNMLGAAIEALINYCKKRTSTNPKDQCALIGYENKATKIFENISISEIDSIKNFCFSNLNPKGKTYFINAFKEAKIILDNINNRNEYTPFIILLSDGLDLQPQDTLNYLKDDVSKFIFNNY